MVSYFGVAAHVIISLPGIFFHVRTAPLASVPRIQDRMQYYLSLNPAKSDNKSEKSLKKSAVSDPISANSEN